MSQGALSGCGREVQQRACGRRTFTSLGVTVAVGRVDAHVRCARGVCLTHMSGNETTRGHLTCTLMSPVSTVAKWPTSTTTNVTCACNEREALGRGLLKAPTGENLRPIDFPSVLGKFMSSAARQSFVRWLVCLLSVFAGFIFLPHDLRY